ncbi:MAG: ABC transporter, partial [Bacteroidetes bacterium]
MAMNSMVVNKMRTLLSLLGITIGIFAIISVFTAVDSLENNVRESIASLGDDVIFIQKWPWGGGESEYKWWEFVKRPHPELPELAIVQKKCKSALAAAFMVSGSKTIKYKNNSLENVKIVSTSHDYDKIVGFEIEKGRYFSGAESLSGRNVAIIGALVSQNLFGNINPMGKYLKVIGRNFKVIGVFKKEGESIVGDSHDAQILLPVNSIRKLLDIHKRHLNPIIMVKAKEGISNAELKDELTGVLRAARKLKPTAENNFALNETSIISSSLDSIFDVIGLAGWLIGGFSILVGGFGIANIMFVSV